MLSKCCRKATVSDKEDIVLLVRRKRGTWYHAFNAGSGVTFLSAPVEPSATIFPGRAARIAPELHREPAITAMRFPALRPDRKTVASGSTPSLFGKVYFFGQAEPLHRQRPEKTFFPNADISVNAQEFMNTSSTVAAEQTNICSAAAL